MKKILFIVTLAVCATLSCASFKAETAREGAPFYAVDSVYFDDVVLNGVHVFSREELCRTLQFSLTKLGYRTASLFDKDASAEHYRCRAKIFVSAVSAGFSVDDKSTLSVFIIITDTKDPNNRLNIRASSRRARSISAQERNDLTDCIAKSFDEAMKP